MARLFSYVKDDKIAVKDFYNFEDRTSFLHLPISQEAHVEFTLLNSWIDALHLDPNVLDAWIWPAPSSGYSAMSFYRIMYSHLPTIEPCKLLWNSKCTMKIKVFALLLFFDRLNTKDRLVRRHWRSEQENNLCVLCSQLVYEDRMHLFFTCNFSMRVWNYLQVDWYGGNDIQQCTYMAYLATLFSWKLSSLQHGIFGY